MLSLIQEIDEEILIKINSGHSEFLTSFFEVLSRPEWAIFFLFAFLFKLYRINKKFLLPGLGLLLLNFALTDFCASGILKPMTKRLRPCHNQEFVKKINRLPTPCKNGRYTMASSHASNSFGMALFWIFFFGCSFRSFESIFLISFASLVSFSRLYLMKHYLSDVLVGMLIAFIASYFVTRIKRPN